MSTHGASTRSVAERGRTVSGTTRTREIAATPLRPPHEVTSDLQRMQQQLVEARRSRDFMAQRRAEAEERGDRGMLKAYTNMAAERERTIAALEKGEGAIRTELARSQRAANAAAGSVTGVTRVPGAAATWARSQGGAASFSHAFSEVYHDP